MQEQDPQGLKDHQARTRRHKIILGERRHDKGRSFIVSEGGGRGQRQEGREGTPQTGSAGQSRKEQAQRMKDQPEKRAKLPAPESSIQGGAAHNPGLHRLAEWAQCPGLEHPGQGQETTRRPLGMEPPEGRGSKKGHKPGLDHPEKTKRASRGAPWTLAARGAAHQSPGLALPGNEADIPGLERPGLNKKEEQKANNNRGCKNKTPRNGKSSGE